MRAHFGLRIARATGLAIALASVFLGARSVSAACADPDICRKAEAAADELRKEFLEAEMEDVFRLVGVRTEGALLVAEIEVQAVMEGLTSAELEKLRAEREAARVHHFCEENMQIRQLIESGVDIRLRTVSKNGVVLNDLIVTDCEAN
jgi:hypothetical protein